MHCLQHCCSWQFNPRHRRKPDWKGKPSSRRLEWCWQSFNPGIMIIYDHYACMWKRYRHAVCVNVCHTRHTPTILLLLLAYTWFLLIGATWHMVCHTETYFQPPAFRPAGYLQSWGSSLTRSQGIGFANLNMNRRDSSFWKALMDLTGLSQMSSCYSISSMYMTTNWHLKLHKALEFLEFQAKWA